ncbi:hypothetical protein B0H14DRAFT_2659282 [Mycena olivaceomarginata]|nr:hypothetical protein B0H14DRAFT_2659282 [Mycena olivaceomarginata]
MQACLPNCDGDHEMLYIGDDGITGGETEKLPLKIGTFYEALSVKWGPSTYNNFMEGNNSIYEWHKVSTLDLHNLREIDGFNVCQSEVWDSGTWRWEWRATGAMRPPGKIPGDDLDNDDVRPFTGPRTPSPTPTKTAGKAPRVGRTSVGEPTPITPMTTQSRTKNPSGSASKLPMSAVPSSNLLNTSGFQGSRTQTVADTQAKLETLRKSSDNMTVSMSIEEHDTKVEAPAIASKVTAKSVFGQHKQFGSFVSNQLSNGACPTNSESRVPASFPLRILRRILCGDDLSVLRDDNSELYMYQSVSDIRARAPTSTGLMLSTTSEGNDESVYTPQPVAFVARGDAEPAEEGLGSKPRVLLLNNVSKWDQGNVEEREIWIKAKEWQTLTFGAGYEHWHALVLWGFETGAGMNFDKRFFDLENPKKLGKTKFWARNYSNYSQLQQKSGFADEGTQDAGLFIVSSPEDIIALYTVCVGAGPGSTTSMLTYALSCQNSRRRLAVLCGDGTNLGQRAHSKICKDL